MNKVLILYPKEFNCKPKFDRKLNKILQNMDELSVIFPSDPNSLIASHFEEKSNVRLEQKVDWSVSDITHAIVFDDGEVFPNEVKKLKAEAIRIREIRIPITRVVNIKKETEFKNLKSTPSYEYIGRGSYWGNPYSMYDEGESREEVIRKYEYDFQYDKFPNKKKSDVLKLAGKRLGCFCKPQACHGDVLANYLNSWDDGK